MVIVVEHVGLQDVEENDAVVPVGNPDTENKTDWVAPDERVAVIAFVTDCPCVTDLFPSLLMEKLNAAVDVIVVRASAGAAVPRSAITFPV